MLLERGENLLQEEVELVSDPLRATQRPGPRDSHLGPDGPGARGLLRRKAFIERIPGRHVYRATPRGRALACFLTNSPPASSSLSSTELDHAPSPTRGTPRPIVTAWRHYEQELTTPLDAANIAA